jgi:hypothetical protein
VTRLNALAFTIFSMVMVALAYGLTNEALAWINEGRGLHPVLAMPLATLAIVLLAPVFIVLSNEE